MVDWYIDEDDDDRDGDDVETVSGLVYVRETALAWLVRVAGDAKDDVVDGDDVVLDLDGGDRIEVWLPKSQCTIEPVREGQRIGVGVAVTAEMPAWLARERGLV